MALENLNEMVELVRNCFFTRDFTPMVEKFSENGIYETPYSAENARFEGENAIRKRFAQVSESPWNKAVRITAVNVNAIEAKDGMTVTVEFSINGIRLCDNKTFAILSSIAIIEVRDGQIQTYRDYPNITGIRSAAGL
jgi:ketosteroid isomerase-like protein